MNTILKNNLDNFLGEENSENSKEVCDLQSGICYIKATDGLIERKIIEKKLVIKDGRELLIEETPISHSSKQYIR